MNKILLTAANYLEIFLKRDDGQDLVEYALVVALIAFGGMAGMRSLSTGLNRAFSNVASTLTTNV